MDWLSLGGRERELLITAVRNEWLLSVSLALLGCSSDGQRTAAAACNTLVDDAPLVTVQAEPAAAPAPTGGAIADGTYALSALTLYTGVNGTSASPPGSLSAVFEIANGVMQQVGIQNGVESRFTTNFSIAGSTLTTVDTCPAPDSESLSFTGAPTEFRVYQALAQGTLEQVYSKR
ncbi:MAG TPA: hypothetical protein VGI10_09595 [Polyangiaceae bacterium]